MGESVVFSLFQNDSAESFAEENPDIPSKKQRTNSGLQPVLSNGVVGSNVQVPPPATQSNVASRVFSRLVTSLGGNIAPAIANSASSLVNSFNAGSLLVNSSNIGSALGNNPITGSPLVNSSNSNAFCVPNEFQRIGSTFTHSDNSNVPASAVTSIGLTHNSPFVPSSANGLGAISSAAYLSSNSPAHSPVQLKVEIQVSTNLSISKYFWEISNLL